MQNDVLAFGFSLIEETPALTRKAMTLTPDRDQVQVLVSKTLSRAWAARGRGPRRSRLGRWLTRMMECEARRSFTAAAH
jgi:DNA-directed RNA polymerase specialized sigma24 family protein